MKYVLTLRIHFKEGKDIGLELEMHWSPRRAPNSNRHKCTGFFFRGAGDGLLAFKHFKGFHQTKTQDRPGQTDFYFRI